jgi:hypothetical protein
VEWQQRFRRNKVKLGNVKSWGRHYCKKSEGARGEGTCGANKANTSAKIGERRPIRERCNFIGAKFPCSPLINISAKTRHPAAGLRRALIQWMRRFCNGFIIYPPAQARTKKPRCICSQPGQKAVSSGLKIQDPSHKRASSTRGHRLLQAIKYAVLRSI